MATLFGVGVMAIALFAIEQGSGRMLIGSVVGMAFLTIMLIFGVEIDEIRIDFAGNEIVLDFTNTSDE
jgi:hypothetical protein